MFGISLSKILFTIVIVLAVFWIYRQINLLTDGTSKADGKSGKSANKDTASAATDAVEDLSACPACGAYVAAGSNPGCGRPANDCPMQS